MKWQKDDKSICDRRYVFRTGESNPAQVREKHICYRYTSTEGVLIVVLWLGLYVTLLQSRSVGVLLKAMADELDLRWEMVGVGSDDGHRGMREMRG